MESNLTVTIFSEEYRDLVKTKCDFEILVGLLVEEMELSYTGDELRLSGINATKILSQFAPMDMELKRKELLAEQERGMAKEEL